MSFVKRLDRDAFVASVKAYVFAVEENSLNAVGRDANFAKISAVGRAHDHRRDYGDAGPLRFAGGFYGVENVRAHGGSRAFAGVGANDDRDLVIGNYFLQFALNIFGRVFGQYATVHVGGSELRQCISGVSAFQ